MKILRFFLDIFAIFLFTVGTQIGGLMYILSIFIDRIITKNSCMNLAQIYTLAKTEPLDTTAIHEKLLALRAQNLSILQCIYFVKVNQNMSLSDARDFTLDSPAWEDRKERFLHLQELMKDDIEEENN